MPEPELIISEHYKAVREEEMERLRHRDQYLIQFIIGSGIIGGVYVSNPKWWILLNIIPLFAAVVSFMYAHTDITLGALSKWLRYNYTEMINNYRNENGINYDFPHWDGSGVHKQYVKGIAFKLRYYSVSLITSGISLISILMMYEHFKMNLCLKILSITILVVLTILALVAPFWALRVRTSQT